MVLLRNAGVYGKRRTSYGRKDEKSKEMSSIKGVKRDGEEEEDGEKDKVFHAFLGRCRRYLGQVLQASIIKENGMRTAARAKTKKEKES